MKTQVGAIVMGGHFQGLGVIRALASKGVPVLLMDKEPCLARVSRYVERYVRCPGCEDENGLLRCFESLAGQPRYRGWVIFPTDDEGVFFLSRHKAQLESFFRITTPDWDIVRTPYDKKQSYTLAEKIGIPIPRSFYPGSEKDLQRIPIPYPLILKPAVMRTFFKQTGKKVFRAADPGELARAYRKAAEIIGPEEIIIQEEIPEVSKHLFSFCPMFKEKKVLARVVAQRLRQHPMDFGQASTYAVTVEMPELEEMGTRLLSAMNYYGLCEVEFIQDVRDGLFKFLEVNPRVWGWHTLAVRAGVNLPYFAFLDRIGVPFRDGAYERNVKWMRLITDIPTAGSLILRGRMSFREYLSSWKGKREFAVLSRRDPLPFFGELLLAPYLWKKRGF